MFATLENVEVLSFIINNSNSKPIIFFVSKNKIKLIAEKLFQIIGTLEVNIDYPEYYDVHDVKSQEIIFKPLSFKSASW